MAKRTVGVQLIIFGKRTGEDLPGMLDDVAAAGFQAVETRFLGEQVSGKDFKKMLDDRGLVHVGVHFGGGAHLDKLGPVVDWMAETGGTDIPLSDNTLVDAPLDLYKQRGQEFTEAAAESSLHPWIVVEQDVPNPGETAQSCCVASRSYVRDTLDV